MVEWTIAIAVFVCDVFGKYAARCGKLPSGPLFRGKFRFLFVKNYGFAFGALRKHPRVVCAASVCAAVAATAVVWRYVWAVPSPFLLRFGFALLLAGAWNNVTDRLIRGFVTDWLNFPRVKAIRRISFNLSDVALVFGAIFAGIGAVLPLR